MARRSISIEEKIEAQKELVSKAKDRYEAELDKLEKLMRKRDELRSKELMEAFTNSERSFEEVMVSDSKHGVVTKGSLLAILEKNLILRRRILCPEQARNQQQLLAKSCGLHLRITPIILKAVSYLMTTG